MSLFLYTVANKQLPHEVFVISRVIKVEEHVSVISRAKGQGWEQL